MLAMNAVLRGWLLVLALSLPAVALGSGMILRQIQYLNCPWEDWDLYRAASRWDYSLRMMQWMDHYLRGEVGEPPPYAIDARSAWEGTRPE